MMAAAGAVDFLLTPDAAAHSKTPEETPVSATRTPATGATPDPKGRSVVIFTPCDDGHKLCFWESMRRFERAYYTGQLNTPHTFEVVTWPGDSLVPRARNNFLKQFITQTKADVMFPIDSDLDFLPEDILRLTDLLVERDLDFLCGRYAIKEDALRWCENALPGKTPDAEGVVELAMAPGGVHLVTRRMVESIIARADEWPHWRIRYTDDGARDERWNIYFNGVVLDPKEWPERPLGRYLSEDWGFSFLARKMGFRIFCDTRTVMLHRGETFYPHAARRMTREEVENGIRNPDGTMSFPLAAGPAKPQSI